MIGQGHSPMVALHVLIDPCSNGCHLDILLVKHAWWAVHTVHFCQDVMELAALLVAATERQNKKSFHTLVDFQERSGLQLSNIVI